MASRRIVTGQGQSGRWCRRWIFAAGPVLLVVVCFAGLAEAAESFSACYAPATLPQNLPLGSFSPALCFQYGGLQAQMYTIEVRLIEFSSGNHLCGSSQVCPAVFPIDNRDGNNSSGQVVAAINMDVHNYSSFHWQAQLYGPHPAGSVDLPVTGTTSDQPPVLSPIGNQMVPAGQSLTFSVSLFDPDGETLTIQAQGVPTTGGLPAGSSFDPMTKIFAWPNPVIGTYRIW